MRYFKVIVIAVALVFSANIIAKPVYAIDVQGAVTVIMNGLEKHGDKIKDLSGDVYNAAEKDELSTYCVTHADKCIEVATIVSTMVSFP